jgi:hypothetical protein
MFDSKRPINKNENKNKPAKKTESKEIKTEKYVQKVYRRVVR